MRRRLNLATALGMASAVAALATLTGCADNTPPPAVEGRSDRLASSRNPPGGLAVDRVPQFVAITFDDNFQTGGMNWATTTYRTLTNPAGIGRAATFDGTPARTGFYHNSIYIESAEPNRMAWRRAVTDGHETADHTRGHPAGTMFTAAQWLAEIKACRDRLTDPQLGVGVTRADVVGFRAPYLFYNQEMFNVLVSEGFRYDTSIQSCWANAEDGTNCAWPHTLEAGSPDATVLTEKFRQPALTGAAGLWEFPLSALVIPPDTEATRYAFPPGLRGRIPANMPPPNYYEASSGKIAPLDTTLFVNALLTSAEVLAILKYNLDLHLGGNRAPLVFVAHTHVYDASYTAATRAPMAAERQQVIAQFLTYALSQPAVRVRPVRDIMAWMSAPMPLTGGNEPTPDSGTADGAGAGDAAISPVDGARDLAVAGGEASAVGGAGGGSDANAGGAGGAVPSDGGGGGGGGASGGGAGGVTGTGGIAIGVGNTKETGGCGCDVLGSPSENSFSRGALVLLFLFVMCVARSRRRV